MALRKTLLPLSILLLATGPIQAEEIHDAVERGDLEAITAILEKDPTRLDVRNDDGLTPANLAALRGHVAVVEELLLFGADTSIGDTEGSLLLHNAAAGGALQVVELLLGEGVALSVPDNNGMTPLHFAVEYRRVPIAELLIEAGAELHGKSSASGSTPLGHAVRHSNLHLATLLLEAGAKVDARDDGERTPLHHAAQNGALPICELLLDHGAELEATDRWGRSPLFLAASARPELARLLLSRGAKMPPAPDGSEYEDAPLHYAARQGNPQTIGIYLEHGAALEARDRNGLTALHIAVNAGHAAAVELLLSKGASLTAEVPGFDRSVLHLAAASGEFEVARILLERGADRSFRDARSRTPLELAVEHGFTNLARLLAGEDEAPSVLSAEELLSVELAQGQAQVVHLGHSGWAIRTARHFLIFDWTDEGSGYSSEASLVNGNIVADELKGEQVVVFASHEHGDHYSPRIFEWAQTLPDVRYVLGLDPGEVAHEYTYLPPRTEQKVGDLTVTTIDSNDIGVGFLVEVDGLAIMHAGDHANRTTEPGEERDAYMREIDYLAEKGVAIDLAFYPISGCGFGNPEAVAMGVGYAMKKLRPEVLVPMHAGDSFYLYPEFARRFPDPSGHTRIVPVADLGDRFDYDGREVRQ